MGGWNYLTFFVQRYDPLLRLVYSDTHQFFYMEFVAAYWLLQHHFFYGWVLLFLVHLHICTKMKISFFSLKKMKGLRKYEACNKDWSLSYLWLQAGVFWPCSLCTHNFIIQVIILMSLQFDGLWAIEGDNFGKFSLKMLHILCNLISASFYVLFYLILFLVSFSFLGTILI